MQSTVEATDKTLPTTQPQRTTELIHGKAQSIVQSDSTNIPEREFIEHGLQSTSAKN